MKIKKQVYNIKDFDFETIGYLSYLGAVLSYVDTEEYAYSDLSNAIRCPALFTNN